MRQIIELVLLVLLVVAVVMALKWKLAVLTLIAYMEKNQCSSPSDEELKECTEYVAKNIVRDLFGIQ